MYSRILIVRLSSLGDVALTLPFLFALRKNMMTSHIGWVVDKPFAPLLEDLVELDRLHVWRKNRGLMRGLRRLINEIREEAYEVSFDVQGLARSSLVPILAGIPIRVGFKQNFLEGREFSPLLNNRIVSPPKGLTHISARTLYLGTTLRLEMPEKMTATLPRNARAEIRVAQWWADNHLLEQTIIFGIGAGWPTRMWAVNEMVLLIDDAEKKGYRSIVLWGPAERSRIKDWQKSLENRVLWAPETNIPEMISLLRRCTRYAGPDSAALHLAWLLGKPTFSWYGASDPARTAPPGPSHVYVAKGPHTWHRKKSTPTGLQTLTGTEALPLFRKWLAEPK